MNSLLQGTMLWNWAMRLSPNYMYCVLVYDIDVCANRMHVSNPDDWKVPSTCSDILSRQYSAASDGLDYLFHCKSVFQGRGHCPDPYEHSTWTPMLRFHHTRKLNQQSFCVKWLCLVTHWWRLRMLQLLQSEKTTSTLCRLKLLKSFPFSHFTHNIVDALTQEHVGDTTVGKSYPG